MAVGAEVAHPFALAAPDHHRAGPLVVEGHGQPRIALVVLQPDVVPGQVGLNERMLQDQCIDLALHHDPLDVVGLGHHLGRAGQQFGRVLPVVGEAVAQGFGLSHVQHPALGVVELVRPRRIGDGACGGLVLHQINSRGHWGWGLPGGCAAVACGRRDCPRTSGEHQLHYVCRPGFRHDTSHRGRHTRGWATRLSPPANRCTPSKGAYRCSGFNPRSPSAIPPRRGRSWRP